MPAARNVIGLSSLVDRSALKHHLTFSKGPGDVPVACIKNKFASAEISLHGAHVLSYQPHEEVPVLWLSKTAVYKEDKAIRGGIPICWPWFASHPTDSNKPAHGFARTSAWSMQHIEPVADGGTRVYFTLSETPESLALWPHEFTLTTIITVGKRLSVELITLNRSDKNMTCSGALHSYVNIDNAEKTLITGLEDQQYIDKLEDMALKTQNEPLRVDQAMDRIYVNTNNDCRILDKAFCRTINISKQGSNSTVIWNPGIDAAADMSDFDDEGYKSMVCVESANAGPDIVVIKPGDMHRLQTTISTQLLL